jgi:hypothetical protein
MSYLNVAEEAAEACLILANQLEAEHKALSDQGLLLKRHYEENQEGLGQHSESIAKLIDQLNQNLRINVGLSKATKKIRRASAIITAHINGGFPISSATPNIEQPNQTSAYLAGVMSRIYEHQYRKMQTPQQNGQWKENVFVPNRDACPQKFNPRNWTFGQIIDNLEKTYGIHVTEIPFRDGWADFSVIAIAQISEYDIAQAYYPNMLTDMDTFDEKRVYENRNLNLSIADHIAAELQLPIPGLTGYSAGDLAEWRKENHFTWDESPLYGYLLVPSEVHNNIPHTGLVSMMVHLKDMDKSISSRHSSD